MLYEGHEFSDTGLIIRGVFSSEEAAESAARLHGIEDWQVWPLEVDALSWRDGYKTI